jgi:hypothetical protein
MNHNIKIDEKGCWIDNTLINEKVFQEELSDYTIREREDFIDILIDWIGDAHDRPNDLYLMKEDLKMLINKTDEFMFSSISTNEYIFSDDEDFDEICEEILKLNEKLRKENIRSIKRVDKKIRSVNNEI